MVSKTTNGGALSSFTVFFHRGRGNTKVSAWSHEDASRFFWEVCRDSASDGCVCIDGQWYDVAAVTMARPPYRGPHRRTWHLEPHGGHRSNLDEWLSAQVL